MAYALETIGIRWGAALVSAGAIAGLTTGVLVFIGSQSRLLYSMARDGLLPQTFANVSGSGVPMAAVACVCAAGSLLAGVLPIGAIAQLCNMGTLWAFFMVAAAVLVMRKTHLGLRRPFRVPAVPMIPLCAMGMCAFLALQLDPATWAVFGIWTLSGLAPVSYTHLDVYKRQLLYRADKASRNCFVCEAQSQCNWKPEKRNREIRG